MLGGSNSFQKAEREKGGGVQDSSNSQRTWSGGRRGEDGEEGVVVVGAQAISPG